MKTFRDKSILRVLGFALVLSVLFVGGWAGDGFARVQMHNGSEGDPLDGSDIVGGGSGSAADQGSSQPVAVISLDGFIFNVDGFFVQIHPEIHDGQIVWVFTIVNSRGALK